jgi:hypothetical protein
MNREEQLQLYRDTLLQGGISFADAERATETLRREHGALDRGLCPRCDAVVKPDLQERQAGPSQVHGLWIQYLCSGCGYRVDRKEVVHGIHTA